MFVLTVDQRGSRRDDDRVEDLLRSSSSTVVVRAFERTAGDEVQAVLDDAGELVRTTLALVRDGHWSVGIGIGPVSQPLPDSTRAGRGPAFERARTAVERAKSAPTHLAVEGAGSDGSDAQAVLDLVALLVQRRSAQGWAAVELVEAGHTQAEAAQRLGVTPQAVSQRLRAAGWQPEQAGRQVAATLLHRADTPESGTPQTVTPGTRGTHA